MRRIVVLAASAVLSALLTPLSAGAVETEPAAPYNILTMSGSFDGSGRWAIAYGEEPGDYVGIQNYTSTTRPIGIGGSRPHPNGYGSDSASVTLQPPVGEDRLEAGRTYAVAHLADETHAALTRSINSSSCQATGSFTVHELEFGEDGRPSRMAITYDVGCPGASPSSTHGELRWNSATGYEAVEVSPTWTELLNVVVGTTHTRTVTYRNAGTSGVTISALEFAGPSADDWSIASTDCLTTLAPGASCTAQVAVTPTMPGSQDTLLRFHDDTGRGPHTAEFEMDVDGVSRPTNVKVAGLQGRNVVTWQPGPGRPPARYEVRRSGGGSATFKLPAGTTSFVDDSPGDGTVLYEVVAFPAETGINDRAAYAPRVAGKVADRELILVGDDGTGARRLMIGSVGSSTSVTDDPSGVVTSGPSLATGGRWVFYTKGTGAAADVWRYDAAVGPYRSLTQCVSCRAGATGTDPAFSPDSARVALVSPTGALLLWHQYLADDVRVVSGVSGVVEPSWLRDGSGLIVASPAGGALRRVALSGSSYATGSSTALPGTEGARKPAVSPDNSHVAYLVPVAGGQALRVVPLAGGAPTSVLPGADLRGVSWTPDGSGLVVTRGVSGGGSEVVSVSLASGATTTLFTSAHRLDSALLRLRDLTPPQLTITGPAATGLNATINFSATDNVTPAAGLMYYCALDHFGSQPCGPTRWTGPVSPGPHTLTVSVTDVAGGNGTSAAHNFTAAAPIPDRTPPHTTLTSKRYKRTTDRTPTFTFTANESPVRFQCRMDDGPWKTCKSGWTSPRLAKGLHTFRVRAADRSGNVDKSPEVHNFRVK